ncbi:MAG TPA: DinB family protein [Methylomirabilota bacterium]|nr:DinB family protein [Methylomirabilota bacterium]
MSIALIREHYEYHQWANRRLFELASGLGDGVTRDMGKHWSFPTLKGTFAHIYGADHVWLTRWKGESPSRLRGDADFSSMDELRATWDAFEAEQRGFVTGLAEADLTRPVHYKNTQGQEFQVALGALLQHVVNHATHHRSEAATMITLISGSPPDTGINTYRVAVVKG